MKKIICLLIPVFVFTKITIAQSADEPKIAANVSAFNKALVDADKKVLESLTADELSYGHSNGKVENKTQFVTAATNGTVDFLSIDITEQTIQIAGKTAIVRHLFSSKLTREGKPDEIKIGILMIWHKQKDEWKLLARQGYKL